MRGTSGRLKAPRRPIDVGNSGTTLRIAMGSASLVPEGTTITLNGDEQTHSRPVGPLMQALRDLGADCRSLKAVDRAPVAVEGRLQGGKTSIACATSQYLSSLLLCTPLAAGESEIEVTMLNEPGYVQMTLDWLDSQKIAYENERLRRFRIQGNQHYSSFQVCVPGDFSSATFFLCGAALLGDEVTLRGLDLADSQPDKAVIDYLRSMGADIAVSSDSIVVKSRPLRGVDIDMNATPDALPAMAVTAAFASGETRLLNVGHARAKETDRIGCTVAELRKMNVDAEELPDGIVVRQSTPQSAALDGHADHRIVMALSLAAMAAEGQSSIETAEAVSITFPTYVQLMSSLGAHTTIQQ